MSDMFIDWNTVVNSCESIADFFNKTNIVAVVGIARGGVIPGSIISRALDTEFTCIKAKSYNSNNTRGKLTIDVSENLKFSNGSVLIVDDICDSGYTLDEVKKYMTVNYNNQFYTATLFYKENKIFTPDFYYMKVPSNIWVTYPWETTK